MHVCPVTFPLALSTGHGYVDVARPWSVSALLSHSSANTRVHAAFIGASAECDSSNNCRVSVLYKNSTVLQVQDLMAHSVPAP